MRRSAKKATKGQSLIELIIGIGIVAILASSFISAIVIAVRVSQQSALSKTASDLSVELSDKVRSVAEGSWLKLYSLDTKDAASAYFLFNEDTIVANDTLSSAGTFSSLVLDSADNPVIAYYADIDNLKVLHCNDNNCAGDDESIETPDSGGFFNSIQLNGPNPVIAHYNNATEDFKIVHCNDADCDPTVNGAESSELIINARVSGFSLRLDASNNPVVSYHTETGNDLKLLHCTDEDCAGVKNIENVDVPGSVGDYTALRLDSDGFPVIGYPRNGKVKLAHCNDINCAGGDESIVIVDGSTINAEFLSMRLDLDGYPVMSYYDAGPRRDLKILHCNDVNCVGGDESIETVDTLGGQSTSLQLDISGYPVVSYIANDKLRILHCNDPNCSGGDESIISVDDADPQANISGTSLQLDSNWNPVVSYYDDINDDLKILHCDDPNCDVNVFTNLAIASGTEVLKVGNATYTRWFSVENVNRDASGNIVDSGGAEDTSTQKITVTVQWPFRKDIQNITTVEYFTRWSKNRITRFTDWGGNFGVEGPIEEEARHYSTSSGLNLSTQGELKL